MAEDILKRINEILEQGIKATGIDADPTDTSKYGFAPEHGSLIRELEELELLEELQELVGGEEKLGELIASIAFKQEEVSPRYQTQEFQNFNVEGEPIGKRAYGITTKELQQKEIQDVIKNFIDTPTNVVDDFYVITPKQLLEAIDLMKNANQGEIFDTHNELISELKEFIYQDLGFNARAEGTMADLDTVLDDWLTSQGTFEDTKFFNNFPKIENLPDPKNVRGLVAAAGGPKEIKEGYVQPQYFKDKPNVPYVDTPTNVVDDAPLLETRFNYGLGEIDEWADDVIKPNKVFNPDSFTRYTGEGEEYIWNRTTSFDAKELYERILKNRASDEDITKFFIYLASHSPSTAYAHKPYFQADALSDIVKIGIFSDKPITEVIPMGVFRDEAFFLDRLQSRNSELGPEINKV